jgi:TRAP-type uncharacterized transport system fused permease subunit
MNQIEEVMFSRIIDQNEKDTEAVYAYDKYFGVKVIFVFSLFLALLWLLGI